MAVVVIHYSFVVSKNEKMTVGKQVKVGVEIVHLIVFDLVKERKVYGTSFPRWIKFYARGASTADYDDGAVR